MRCDSTRYGGAVRTVPTHPPTAARGPCAQRATRNAQLAGRGGRSRKFLIHLHAYCSKRGVKSPPAAAWWGSPSGPRGRVAACVRVRAGWSVARTRRAVARRGGRAYNQPGLPDSHTDGAEGGRSVMFRGVVRTGVVGRGAGRGSAALGRSPAGRAQGVTRRSATPWLRGRGSAGVVPASSPGSTPGPIRGLEQPHRG